MFNTFLFGPTAPGIAKSSCCRRVYKSGKTPVHRPVAGALDGTASPATIVPTTLIRNTHAFSARLDKSGDVVESSAPWEVTVNLSSTLDDSPSVLVGIGPRSAPNPEAAAQEDVAETQSMFEQRVLTTPLIWEEPGFLMLECSDKPPRLWSETHRWYSALPTSLGDEAGRPQTSDVTEQPCFRKLGELWQATLKVRWTPPSPSRLSPEGISVDRRGVFEFFQLDGAAGGGTTDVDAERARPSQWRLIATGRHEEPTTTLSADNVAPYVTLLQEHPSRAEIV